VVVVDQLALGERFTAKPLTKRELITDPRIRKLSLPPSAPSSAPSSVPASSLINSRLLRAPRPPVVDQLALGERFTAKPLTKRELITGTPARADHRDPPVTGLIPPIQVD
jgi:hypothetical protein